MVYPIKLPDGSYKFANSDLIARYIYATDLLKTDYAPKIINRLFTESNSEGINYQSVFLNSDHATAEKLLQTWLAEFGASKKQIDQLSQTATSDEVSDIMTKIQTTVENKIHAKGIPTLIYDGKKHNGLYR